MSDLIDRQALLKQIDIDSGGAPGYYGDTWKFIDTIKNMPSAQQKRTTEFMKLTVRDSNGRPYYSIIYLEFDDNGVGHDFEGYSSYSLDVISDYLKKYFMQSAEPERTDKRTETHACDLISRQAAIDVEGLDEEIRCEMCRNPMHTNRGCDGNCKYDEKLYEKIIQLLDKRITPLPSAQPEQTCVNCGRTANNGGWYADGRTRCPIEEHYALPKDGFCHLWEKRNITDDDYPERMEE